MVSRHCISGARTLARHATQTCQVAPANITPNLCARAISTTALVHPHPSTRHPPQTRGRYGISRPPGWQTRDIAAPCSDEEVVQYFANLLPPLQFPQEVALRMINHSSWKAGMEGTSNKLSFVGRRVMQAYLLALLHAHTTMTPTPPLTQPPAEPTLNQSISQMPTPSTIFDQDFDEIAGNTLHTRGLGEHVGGAWQLERVMRWAPNTSGESISNDSGLYKVRGTTVEAVVGGVFHQFGGVAAHRLFHTRVLPHVSSILPSEYRKPVQDACQRLGGPSAPLVLARQASTHHENLSAGSASG